MLHSRHRHRAKEFGLEHGGMTVGVGDVCVGWEWMIPMLSILRRMWIIQSLKKNQQIYTIYVNSITCKY